MRTTRSLVFSLLAAAAIGCASPVEPVASSESVTQQVEIERLRAECATLAERVQQLEARLGPDLRAGVVNALRELSTMQPAIAAITPPEPASKITLPMVIANLADVHQAMAAKIGLVVGIEPASSTLSARLARGGDLSAEARDGLIAALSSMTSEQLKTPAGKEQLREVAAAKLGELLAKADASTRVVAVYFDEFLVQ